MLDSPQVQSAVRKAVAAVLGFMLALVLLTALLITGFYLLVAAATAALTPVVGESAALAMVGVVCFLVLALVFYHLTRPARSLSKGASSPSGAGSPVQSLRELIRRNPLESASNPLRIRFEPASKALQSNAIRRVATPMATPAASPLPPR